MEHTIEQEINELLTNYHAGNLELAEKQAQILTQGYPNHPFGWKVLGAVLQLLGRSEESVEPTRQSLWLNPLDPWAHNNLGSALRDLGRLNESEASCREAIRLKPDLAEAHNNLGNTLWGLGRLNESEASCREAIRLKPDLGETHNNLGNTLRDLGRLNESEASYREAIRLKPGYAEAHSNLGNVLKDLGRLSEAEANYRKAIRLRPDFAETYNNLGLVLQDLGRLKESEASYREAIRLKPDNANVHNNLGIALWHLGWLNKSEESYRKAIRLRPDFAETYNNLGLVLQDLGRLKESEESYREALRLEPDYDRAYSNLLFSLNYVESLSREAALEEARRYGSRVSAKAIPKFISWLIDSEPTRLRIGFVSADMRNHSVGYFVEGLIKNLDRNQFELYGFPTIPQTDDLTDRIKPHFNRWIPMYGKSDLEAAEFIHQQGIHVLIDLSGHSGGNRLPVFAYKPAPVQASWLGYFATTGLPEMDYFLGDSYTSPQSEADHFTERIWNLPDTWLCLMPPSDPVSISPLPAQTNGYVTFGCFSNLSKMNDRVVKTWAAILNRIPDAKLLLKAKQLADMQMVSDVRNRFAEYGIFNDRLILEGPSSRIAYFEAYNRVDMMLDTFPYPGGTTSVDALWMGTPVLTLKGNRFLSHLGESIAKNAGQSDWIAEDQEDYVRKAQAFALDPRKLAEIRSGLRDQVLKTPLFDTQRFAIKFGEALRGMWNEGSRNLDTKLPNTTN